LEAAASSSQLLRKCQPQVKLLIKLRRSFFATSGRRASESTPGKRLWTG
jgi:hypothetical protein